MKVIGVSFNKPAKNKKWSDKEGFAFELWSDESKELAMYYGAASGKLALAPSRITVVLDAAGDLVLQYDDVSVGTHPADVLEDCTALFGAEAAVSPGAAPPTP